MVMKKLLLIGALLLALSTQGQSYPAQFQEALDKGNTRAQRAILADWQLASPKDVDLYVARWNYYVNGYMEEGQTGDLSIRDRAMVDSGFAVIDEAISLYPDRLDLRFGKIYFLGQIQQWDDFVEEICRTLDYSVQIGHSWNFNGVRGEGKTIMTEGMQDYQWDMYGQIEMVGDSLSAAGREMAQRIGRVAKATLEAFPSDVEAMNMMGVYNMLVRDYERAVKFLLRAEKIAPTHPAVLCNLAECYARLGKKKEAAEMLKRIERLEIECR